MLCSGVEVLLWRRHLESKGLVRVEELSQRLAAVEEVGGIGVRTFEARSTLGAAETALWCSR